MISKNVSLYSSEIKNLENLECKSISAGEGTGSMVVLSFGGGIKKTQSLSNPGKPEINGNSDSEFSIYLEDCEWRVESSKQVICGSFSENSNSGIMVNGLNNLLKQTVKNTYVYEPSLDLKLEFSNGLNLVVFCNTFADERCNFSFLTPLRVFTVSDAGNLLMEYKERKDQ